jgi:carboxymethylenebutenolidase
MTDMQRYVVEEWAEDYRAGRLGRREFLRRITIMAGGAALATPVLSALGLAASPAELEAAAAAPPAIAAAAAAGVTVPPDDPSLTAGMITFPLASGQGIAYLAQPKGGGPYPAVLIIHENRGLLEHFKDVARRFAKAGYAGMAVDLVSQEGGTERFADSAQVSAVLAQAPVERHVETMNAAVRYLQGLSGVRRDRIGAIGFCFGGGMVWRLVTANPDIRAAAPFYGSNPPLADVAKIKAAILAVYGELDTRINAGIPAIREAMQRANVTSDIVIYPGAGHAFFNDTAPAYVQSAAQQAWARVMAWFDRYLKA